MSVCFIEYIKNVPEPLKMMSSWGINQVWEFRFIGLKNNNPPYCLGVRVSISGQTRVLPRSQLVADDTGVGDDLTQPQLQVDLALKGTRTEGHGGHDQAQWRAATSVRKCVVLPDPHGVRQPPLRSQGPRWGMAPPEG